MVQLDVNAWSWTGGFMLIYARKENRNKIIKALSKYLHVPFNFDYTGSQIIYFPKINFLYNLIIPSIIPENINVETKVYPKNGNAKV